MRIDIKKARDIPANIKPYVESSLMGQSSIALLTEATVARPICLQMPSPASGRES